MRDEKTKQYQKRAKEIFNDVVKGLEKNVSKREIIKYIRANLMVAHLKGRVKGTAERENLIREKL